MTYTAEQLDGWVGRDALDADGRLVGTVSAVRRDGAGAPSSLEVATEDGGVVAVPVEGCEEAGSAIRLPIAEAAATARPHPERATKFIPETKIVAQSAVVERLREAYRLEGEGVVRLEALAAAIGDAEVQHEATLHAEQTRHHRTGVEERLHALEESPPKLPALRGPAPSGSPVELLRDAVAFERREAAFYEELEALARAAGDTATADLAAAHRADELAAADGFAASIPRLDSPA